MTNDDTGVPAASTIITAVHLDTVARNACALPEAVLASLRALLPAAEPVYPAGS